MFSISCLTQTCITCLYKTVPTLWECHGERRCRTSPSNQKFTQVLTSPGVTEKERKIAPVIFSLLEQQLVHPCASPYNTPINPVLKLNSSLWFTQDLCAIKSVVKPVTPVVPDVMSILNTIDLSLHFTVIDLSSAFFSISVHPDNQHTVYLHSLTRYNNIPGPASLKGSLTFPLCLHLLYMTVNLCSKRRL